MLEFLCSFGFGEHVWFERLAYIVRDVELVAECAVGYIHYEFVGMLVHGAHEFKNGGRVSSSPECHVAVLYSQSHEGIVTRSIIRYRHHGSGSDIMFLDNRRYISHEHTADTAVQCTVRRVSLDLLTHNREDMSAKDAAAVLDKVPCPDVRHFAINRLEVLVCHRHPLWFAGGAGGGSVHIRLTGEEDIGLTVLVALDVRAERFETLVDRHELLVEEEKILGGRSV